MNSEIRRQETSEMPHRLGRRWTRGGGLEPVVAVRMAPHEIGIDITDVPDVRSVLQEYSFQSKMKLVVLTCLCSIFVDFFFFIMLKVPKENKCIDFSITTATVLMSIRTATDVPYFFHIIDQFKVRYAIGNLFVDMLSILPVPQVIIFANGFCGGGGAKNLMHLLFPALWAQSIPRLFRMRPLWSQTSLDFGSGWVNCAINFLIFLLCGHVVGSIWYAVSLKRASECLRDACLSSGLQRCMEFIDCPLGRSTFSTDPTWLVWRKNDNATACFNGDNLNYGIFDKAVKLTTRASIIKRYTYALFWGFQQISTLAGNLVPTDSVWEVLFVMAIIGMGIILLSSFIGNMQNFYQSLDHRRSERSVRRRNVTKWFKHRGLPSELRRKITQAERYNRAITSGVNEDALMQFLPENLQRDIRRHLFKLVEKVQIFTLLEEPILDAILERLQRKTYITGSNVFCRGGILDKMVIIIGGRIASIEEDGNITPLGKGHTIGEELMWCLEHSYVHKEIRFPGIINRGATCLTNAEVYVLRSTDLQEVAKIFPSFYKNPRFQGAIKYQSPYWRTLAARCIQAAWRCHKRKDHNRRIHAARCIQAAWRRKRKSKDPPP